MAAEAQSWSTLRIPLTPAVRRVVFVGTLRDAVVPVIGVVLFGLISIGHLSPATGSSSSGAEEGAAMMRSVLPFVGVPVLLAVAILAFGWIRDLRAASYLRTVGPVRTSWSPGYGGGLMLEFGSSHRAQLPGLEIQLKALVRKSPIPRMERGVVDHTEHRHLILAVLDEHGAVLYSRGQYSPPPVSVVVAGVD